MLVSINNIANVQFGYYAKSSNEGTIPYLQAKHFDDGGKFLGQIDTHINDNNKTASNYLDEGDILFTSKGFRFFATLYNVGMGKVVASSVFFVIKPDKSKILPGYLVAILNLPKSIFHFQQLSAGSTIPSIRKDMVLDFTFSLVNLETQKLIIDMQNIYFKEMELSQSIILQKQKLFQETLIKLTNQKNNGK